MTPRRLYAGAPLAAYERAGLMTAAMVCLAAFFAQTAEAVQHLVSPGQDWASLASRLRPGDEIILMPGRHRPAALDEIRGTAERPITIRGLHPRYAPIIEADREGIRLRRPQHVVIRDLTITGASLHGISITAVSAGPGPEPGAESRTPKNLWPAHITIRNVTVSRTGPTGRRHGIRLAGISHVSIEDCRIEGWGGSAVKVIASREVTIRNCRLKGLDRFGQASGIQIRAGSEDVRVERCSIIDAGMTAVAIGGASRPGDFIPPQGDDEEHAAGGRAEAARVLVSRCVIQGGRSAFALINADDCFIRHNTVINPRDWVYLLMDENRAPRAAPTRRSVFGANLIVWRAGDLLSFSHVAESAKAAAGEGLSIEQNLWWSPDLTERREALGPPAGRIERPQVMDVDPLLDDELRPTPRRARVFGATGL